MCGQNGDTSLKWLKPVEIGTALDRFIEGEQAMATEKEIDDKEGNTAKIQLVNRRVSVEVGRTIKTSESAYEFSKFKLGYEADIPDGASREKATDAIFNELMKDCVLREAAIRAAAKDVTVLDRVVIMLRTLLERESKSAGE